MQWTAATATMFEEIVDFFHIIAELRDIGQLSRWGKSTGITLLLKTLVYVRSILSRLLSDAVYTLNLATKFVDFA